MSNSPSLPSRLLAVFSAAGLVAMSPAPAQAQSVSWFDRSVSGPWPRQFHSMCYDTTRNVTILFGGVRSGVVNGETWSWDGTTWLQRGGSGPSPRTGASMAYDAARSVAVLFGGFAPPHPLADTWEWDGTSWSLRAARGPSPRLGHAMAYDAARGVTVLFGGYSPDPAVVFGETWEWNGVEWTLRTTTGPSPRAHAAMAYDSARGVTVLFGGALSVAVSAPTMSGETWEWDGTVWTQRFVSGPSARYTHAMTYDSGRRTTVLHGGYPLPSVPSGDTWEWNGAAWNQNPAAGPAMRSAHAMAFDDARGATVLFGGYDSGDANPETWELACLVITAQPRSQTVCPNGASSFTVATASSSPASFQWQWRHVGEPTNWMDLTEGPNADSSGVIRFVAAGATTPTLTVSRDNHLQGAVDVISALRCVVSNTCGSTPSAVAAVTVCPGDFNCDGTTNPDDLGDFIRCFFTEPPCDGADFNTDGNIDPDDLADFITVFFGPPCE